METHRAKPEIRRVQSSVEFDAVCRFRYQVYVEEMHRAQRYADHQTKRIEDSLDANAINLAAWSRSGSNLPVGIVRVNVGGAGEFGEYDSFYDIDQRYQSCKLAIVTRLMIASEHRHTDLAFRLSVACFNTGIQLAVDYCFLDCNPPLIPFFERLGCSLAAQKRHPEYGEVAVMKFEMANVEHLQKINSPFLKYRECIKAA